MSENSASDRSTVEAMAHQPLLAEPLRIDLAPQRGRAGSSDPKELSLCQCKICGSDVTLVGTKRGKLRPDQFELFRCDACGYSFIANPWLDYPQIYGEDYYNGRGADHRVDYVFELNQPDLTIRQYEWRGIVNVVNNCLLLSRDTRWLDFGCGNGGLVRHVRRTLGCGIWGHEHGWISDEAFRRGIPILDDDAFEQAAGTFDVVTAIEVLEHLADPMAELKRIRSLLRPGGLFFFTTANAAPHRKRLLDWRYMVPEIHISFYEPRTLVEALRRAGFRVEFKPLGRAFQEIIRFKILKNLGARRVAWWEKVVPWPLLTRLADMKYGVTAHPIAWA